MKHLLSANGNVNCFIMAVDIENIMNFIKDVDMTGVQCFAILDNSSKL